MELKEFVKLAKEKGLSKNEITSEFRKKGYSDNEINEAFGEKIINKTNRLNQTKTFEKEPIDKIKMLFLEPSEFFRSVKDETITNSLVLYVIIGLIIILTSYGLGFVFQYLNLNYLYSGNLIGGGFGIASYVLGIIFTFIYSGIVHLTAKIAGGEGRFVDSYNAVTYSLIISSILLIIPIIGFLGFIYSIILAVFGISEYHKVSKGKAVIIVLSPIILLVVFIVFILIIFRQYLF